MSPHNEINLEDEICVHLVDRDWAWAAFGFRKERGNPSPIRLPHSQISIREAHLPQLAGEGGA